MAQSFDINFCEAILEIVYEFYGLRDRRNSGNPGEAFNKLEKKIEEMKKANLNREEINLYEDFFKKDNLKKKYFNDIGNLTKFDDVSTSLEIIRDCIRNLKIRKMTAAELMEYKDRRKQLAAEADAKRREEYDEDMKRFNQPDVRRRREDERMQRLYGTTDVTDKEMERMDKAWLDALLTYSDRYTPHSTAELITHPGGGGGSKRKKSKRRKSKKSKRRKSKKSKRRKSKRRN